MQTWTDQAELDRDIWDIPLIDSAPASSELLDLLTWHVTNLNASGDHVMFIQGYFIPPSDNDYRFFLESADHSQLWLSTDADRNNKVCGNCLRLNYHKNNSSKQQHDLTQPK
jgi:hypothetical protein